MAAILGPHGAMHMIKIKNGGRATIQVPKLAPQPQL
jgi:hypothetical protein